MIFISLFHFHLKIKRKKRERFKQTLPFLHITEIMRTNQL